MAKTATAPAPTQSKKPSIRFVPKRRQYENGIDWTLLSGFRTKITLEGFVAPTLEDERRILHTMEHDPYCGITTWENREMPVEQKKVEGELRASQAENRAMKEELEAMRQELARLQGAQKPAAGGG